ncbi:hypothetical protein CK203_063778 [Vitis vinifera]|uniref:Uncharacterized protein n=1 Tax=Vitis vinifera TaxID=29760 RepID=A0A438GZV9_VITVI|nr:hypothetical protein CK203_063778 [Vitis vinifera]
MLMESALKMLMYRERHGFFGIERKGGEEENEGVGYEGERWTGEEWVVSESVHGGWPCMLDRVCEHGGLHGHEARVYKRGDHACMIPMHVGGWLWDSYGDEHGMGYGGQPVGLMGLELMDWVAGFSERNEATVWVQRGDGVGSIKVVDLGRSPPANAVGWNYIMLCWKIKPRSDVPWLYQE